MWVTRVDQRDPSVGGMLPVEPGIEHLQDSGALYVLRQGQFQLIRGDRKPTQTQTKNKRRYDGRIRKTRLPVAAGSAHAV
eukprot:6061096-Prymnesium_polylepis.2